MAAVARAPRAPRAAKAAQPPIFTHKQVKSTIFPTHILIIMLPTRALRIEFVQLWKANKAEGKATRVVQDEIFSLFKGEKKAFVKEFVESLSDFTCKGVLQLLPPATQASLLEDEDMIDSFSEIPPALLDDALIHKHGYSIIPASFSSHAKRAFNATSPIGLDNLPLTFNEALRFAVCRIYNASGALFDKEADYYKSKVTSEALSPEAVMNGLLAVLDAPRRSSLRSSAQTVRLPDS